MGVLAMMALLATLAGSPALAAQPRYFAPTSFWNTPIDAAAPSDPASDMLVASLAAQAAQGTSFATAKWSVPIYSVPVDQPLVDLALINRNADLRAALARIPIPPSAQPAAGTDGHLVIHQPSTDTMWELFRAAKTDSGWQAQYGGRMTDVSTHIGHYSALRNPDGSVLEQPWWGATATSLPLAGGLVTFRDVRAGRIDHAVAMAVPNVRRGVVAWPAQRSDGKSDAADTIPEGARFQLDPALDLSTLRLTPVARMIAEAAQTYGAIVRDGAGNVAFYGQDPSPTGTSIWKAPTEGRGPGRVLDNFPWSHMRLLEMDLSPYAPGG